MKNIFYVTWVGIRKVDNRLNMILKGDKSCNFSITIFRFNGISPVFLKDSLIVFFLNTCKQILVIRAKNSSFDNSQSLSYIVLLVILKWEYFKAWKHTTSKSWSKCVM